MKTCAQKVQDNAEMDLNYLQREVWSEFDKLSEGSCSRL